MRGTQVSPQSNLKQFPSAWLSCMCQGAFTQDEGAGTSQGWEPCSPEPQSPEGHPSGDRGMSCPQQTISRLVGSMRRRCQAVIDAQGLMTG